MTKFTATLTNPLDAPHDLLQVTVPAGVASSYDPATGVLEVTGEASVSEYTAIVESLKYGNALYAVDAGNPTEGTRVIQMQVFDPFLERNI